MSHHHWNGQAYHYIKETEWKYLFVNNENAQLEDDEAVINVKRFSKLW